METLQQLWLQFFSPSPPPPAALYEQILLFGDSITEFAERQDLGFAFAAALRAGKYLATDANSIADLSYRLYAQARGCKSRSKVCLGQVFRDRGIHSICLYIATKSDCF